MKKWKFLIGFVTFLAAVVAILAYFGLTPKSEIAPAYLSDDDVIIMIKKNNYYDASRNRNGLGIEHKFEPRIQHGDSLVSDAKTFLTWQHSGSLDQMAFWEAMEYVKQKNCENHGGFTDWRLPTLKEAMSLTTPLETTPAYNIDPVFDRTQWRIWTSDKRSSSFAWVVNFKGAISGYSPVYRDNYVRAVRGGNP